MDYNTILVIVATALFGANVYFINKDNKIVGIASAF